MRAQLEPGDRKILIAAGALLVATVLTGALFSALDEEESAGPPSSYSAASHGAKASFLLLNELGYRAQRWTAPPSRLPRPAAGLVLVLAEPRRLLSEQDKQEVAAFLRSGGRVLATGLLATQALPEAEAWGPVATRPQWERYPAALPDPVTRGAPEITLAAQTRWRMRHASHLALYGEEGKVVVVRYRVGRGEVIWWAGSTPLTNAGIREPGNLELLLNSLGPPAGTRVLWDEYFHGAGTASLWGYLSASPVPWGFAHLGVLLLAALAAFGRRSGPVRALPAESRLSPLEFVETLGDLYHRAHAAPAALGVAYQRFRHLLLKRLGLPASASHEEVYEAVRHRLGCHDPELFHTLRHCQRAVADSGLAEEQAVRLVQALHDYTRVLRLVPGAFRQGST